MLKNMNVSKETYLRLFPNQNAEKKDILFSIANQTPKERTLNNFIF